jgi:hypothetical protein
MQDLTPAADANIGKKKALKNEDKRGNSKKLATQIYR